MRLHLVNFKSYTDFKITLPDSGLVMLNGPSGIGKSTLLEALAFLMYDERDSTIYPRQDHKGSTSVKGELKGITIFRQKRPDLLTVETNGTVYNGIAAENWIKAWLGSGDFWFASSYLRQGAKWHFLELTSLEKCNLLQEISSLNESMYEDLANKTNLKLKLTQQELDQVSLDARVEEQRYLADYQLLTDQQRQVPKWSKAEFTTYIEKYRLKKDLTKSLDLWYRQERLPLEERLQKALTVQRQQQENQRLLDQINDLKAKLVPMIDTVELQNQMQYYQRMMYQAEKAQEQVRLNTLIEEHSRFVAPDPIGIPKQKLERWLFLHAGLSVDQLQQIVTNIKNGIRYQELLSKRQQYQQLLQQREQLKQEPVEDPSETINDLMSKLSIANIQREQYQCPSCGTHLYLHQRKLQTTQVVEDPQRLTQALSEAKSKQARYYQQLKTEDLRRRLEAEINAYVEEPLPQETPESHLPVHQLQRDLHQVESMLSEWKQVTMSVDEINEEKKRQEYQQRRAQLQVQINHLQKALQGHQSIGELVEDPSYKYQEYHHKLTLAQQQNEQHRRQQAVINSLEQQIKLVEECTDDVDDLKTKLQQLEQEYHQVKDLLEVQMKLMALGKIKAALNTLKSKEEQLALRVSALKKIQSTLVYAEYFILDTVISKINNKINSILEKIFKEDISIHLRAIRKLKTNDRIKPEINLNITFQGHPVKNLKGLSGGQQARVQLACCLALAKQSKSPYILLDECMANLDATSREHVVEEIRQIFAKEPRLILMANQDTTEGVYDEVIHLR